MLIVLVATFSLILLNLTTCLWTVQRIAGAMEAVDFKSLLSIIC